MDGEAGYGSLAACECSVCVRFRGARVVLFGGVVPGAASFADTWVWDGEAWTQLADTGPDARSGHALAFDSGRARVVLFGGIASDGTLRGDTWEWDGERVGRKSRTLGLTLGRVIA